MKKVIHALPPDVAMYAKKREWTHAVISVAGGETTYYLSKNNFGCPISISFPTPIEVNGVPLDSTLVADTAEGKVS